MSHRLSPGLLCLFIALPCTGQGTSAFTVRQSQSGDTITVHRAGSTELVLTQEAKPDFRPFLHPIVAPDGKGVLTQYSPGHHKHQTGLYWGFTRLNGRDYFHHPEGDYWRRRSAKVLQAKGERVEWQVEYDLLDESGDAVLTETQRWSLREQDGRFVLDLVWRGTANRDVTIGKYDYGGLFLRMPWKPGINGRVTNAARQVNDAAEGQRAPWLDVGMEIAGRADHGHIAIFDHHENPGFPQPWRVDGQMGVGPVRARLGSFTIGKDETITVRHRLIVYTGALDSFGLTEMWKRLRSTVVYVTHDLREALAMAQRVLFLSGRPGRVVLDHLVEIDRARGPADAEVESLYASLLRQHPDILAGLPAGAEDVGAREAPAPTTP